MLVSTTMDRDRAVFSRVQKRATVVVAVDCDSGERQVKRVYFGGGGYPSNCIPLTEANLDWEFPDEPDIRAKVQRWLNKHDAEFKEVSTLYI